MAQTTSHPITCIPAGWNILSRGEGEIIICAPDAIPGGMTLTGKEKSLPQRLLYALAHDMLNASPPNSPIGLTRPQGDRTSGPVKESVQSPVSSTSGLEVLVGIPATKSAPAAILPPHPPAGREDPLYDSAIQIVRATNRASISLVQRHLRIAYIRAARLLEAMEGTVVGPMDGSGCREVLQVPGAQPAPKG